MGKESAEMQTLPEKPRCRGVLGPEEERIRRDSVEKMLGTASEAGVRSETPELERSQGRGCCLRSLPGAAIPSLFLPFIPKTRSPKSTFFLFFSPSWLRERAAFLLFPLLNPANSRWVWVLLSGLPAAHLEFWECREPPRFPKTRSLSTSERDSSRGKDGIRRSLGSDIPRVLVPGGIQHSQDSGVPSFPAFPGIQDSQDSALPRDPVFLGRQNSQSSDVPKVAAFPELQDSQDSGTRRSVGKRDQGRPLRVLLPSEPRWRFPGSGIRHSWFSSRCRIRINPPPYEIPWFGVGWFGWSGTEALDSGSSSPPPFP
ncbi:uncharacterized protein [Phaenicophaeus curvirostris]|uniref:uncharacterized protein isoform X1 n=1 Tax=Phaenicophaeus curvirostris TaxID=33595 RepID=UPI0037F0F13A